MGEQSSGMVGTILVSYPWPQRCAELVGEVAQSAVVGNVGGAAVECR
jgi:hypothetical protein